MQAGTVTVARRLLQCAWLIAFTTPVAFAAAPVLVGGYESARTSDDEFVRVTLEGKGRAVIVEEHNFQIPGDPAKRRGRTTTYGKWSRKGNSITLTYARIKDRLRYDAALSLQPLGQSGTAAALTPIKPVDGNSRLKNLILWRLPHAYRQPAQDGGSAPPAASAK